MATWLSSPSHSCPPNSLSTYALDTIVHACRARASFEQSWRSTTSCTIYKASHFKQEAQGAG